MILPDNPGSQLLGTPPPRSPCSVLSFHLPWMVSVFWALCLALFPHHTTPASRASLTAPENSFLHVLRTQISSQPRCLPLPRSAPSSSPAGGSRWGGPRVPQKVPTDLSVTPSHVPLLPLPLAHLIARSQHVGCWQSSRTCLDEPSPERPDPIKRE